MKLKILRYILATCLMFHFTGCNKWLDIQPLDRVPSEQLLADQGGIKALLARLYNRMPVEDFNYRPNAGFQQRGWNGVGAIIMTTFLTDESHQAAGTGVGPVSDGYWAYNDIREVNLFLQSIESVRESGGLTDDNYRRLKSEAHFVRAYMYFALAKRYGGVPLIDRVLDHDYMPGSDNANLYIPRSTEKATWDFILNECDLAIQDLPEVLSGEDGVYRASKWAAYGLKSRVALFAASVAKHWNRASLAGDAVTQQLVGMNSADAASFYDQCISASRAILDGSGKSLYMPNPGSPQEAARNFQNLFMAQNSEILFSRGYLDGTVVASQGHTFDTYYQPAQTNTGFHKWGRFNPTRDIVDLFEDYSDDGTGRSVKVVTRTDGNEDYVIANPINLDINLPFKKYNSLLEPFQNKDARLLGSVIVPGAAWKGTNIIIQGGLIQSNGNRIIYSDGTGVGPDGQTYYSFGAEGITNYSGFRGLGQSDDANYTSSGFLVKKYLQEDGTLLGSMESSTTDFVDIRLAEIYLNYAEAVVESGQGDAVLAGNLLNALRRRAAHTDVIPLTLENVLKERRVELAFEGHRYWDLVRRREFHTLFNLGKRKALVPIIDLREAEAKYIFVRANNYYDENAGGWTFQPFHYYRPIPGRNTNNLVENPQY